MNTVSSSSFASSSRRLEAYLASLPAGLDSYPTCAQKGSVVRAFLAGAPQLRNLPEPLRVLASEKPLATSWVPEVHTSALYLALADQHFPRESDFLAYCARRNADLLRSPMYRALLAIGSPAMMLQAIRMAWPLFHRGTSLAVIEKGPGRARLQMAFPPGVIPELIARGIQTAFSVFAVDTLLTRPCTSELVEWRRDAATYEVFWK